MNRILASKLSKPEPCPDLVSRPRLIALLDDPDSPPFSVVTAPAGFGKSMLLAEWLSGTQQDVAWLALDPLDNHPIRFLCHLVEAIRTLVPGLGEPVLADLRSPDPPPLDVLMSDVIHDIDEASKPLRLVLDDVHVLESEEVLRVLRFLIKNITPNLRLVLSGRSEPGLPIAKLRLQGDLVEIRADDLRFRREEIAAFLRQGQKLEVSDETVESVASRTEGWIAGIRMACHSIVGVESGDEVEARLAEFSGQDRHLTDYFIDEVFSRLEPDLREFLVGTSILESLHGPLCDAVTGVTGGKTRLEELERSNLFLSAVDRKLDWYRYHHLFAELLRSRLADLGEDEVSRLHRRASEWYEDHEMREEALQHAIDARDWPHTVRLLDPYLREVLDRGAHQRILRWLDAIPEEVRRDNIELILRKGWAQFLGGRIDDVGSTIDAALAAGNAASDPANLGEIEALAAQFLRFRGDLEGVLRKADHALELLPPERGAARSSCHMIRGTVFRFQGRLSDAVEPLERAIRLGEESGSDPFRFGSMNVLSNVDCEQGRLHRAARRFQDVIALCGPARPVHVIEAHAALGNIYREWNRLDDAEQTLRTAIEIATRRGVEIHWPHAFYTLARVYQARGDHERAFEEVEFALEQSETRGYARGLRLVRAERARIRVVAGDLAPALEWLRESDFGAADPAAEIHELPIRSRVLGAHGRRDEAAPLLALLEERCRESGRIRDLVECLVLRARYRTDSDGSDPLKESVELAEELGMVRVFLDEAEGIRKDVERLSAELPYARRLRKLLGESKLVSPARVAEALSERELEVLQQIEAGLSNQEIGRALFVSPNTVKTHIQRIFGKLAVRSRTQAVAAARVLDIIE